MERAEGAALPCRELDRVRAHMAEAISRRRVVLELGEATPGHACRKSSREVVNIIPAVSVERGVCPSSTMLHAEDQHVQVPSQCCDLLAAP